MPIVETEVEKSAAQGAAMEITVSRQELVKELTATQSVGRPRHTVTSQTSAAWLSGDGGRTWTLAVPPR